MGKQNAGPTIGTRSWSAALRSRAQPAGPSRFDSLLVDQCPVSCVLLVDSGGNSDQRAFLHAVCPITSLKLVFTQTPRR